MEYENKFVGLSSVMSHDLEILRYELEYGWKLALIPNDVWWWIDYRYKPDYCERTKQHTIREESLFDTEQEALIALFEEFKDKVKRKLEFFNKESKKLGIKQELRLLL